jgi:hypothetical protein
LTEDERTLIVDGRALAPAKDKSVLLRNRINQAEAAAKGPH